MNTNLINESRSKKNIITESHNQNTNNTCSIYPNLTEILSNESIPLNPIRLEGYTFANLNFDKWIDKVEYYQLREREALWYSKKSIINKLKLVPTNSEEIGERQSFIKELYYNDEFTRLISQCNHSLSESFRWVNTITGNWARKEDQPFYRFFSYITFLDFINKAGDSVNIKNTNIIPLKTIGETINKNKKDIANLLVDYFLPISESKGMFEMRSVLNNDFNDHTFSKRYEAAKYLLNVFEEFSSKNKNIFIHEKLSAQYQILKTVSDRNCFNEICDNINKNLENQFPVLNTIGNYFDEHKLPDKVINLWNDLNFYVGITKIMKNYEDNGLPVVFPIIHSKEQRTVHIERGSELYLASTKVCNDIQLNDVLHTPEEHCFFITGPNGTAKTTYTRQIGQEHIMAMHGFPIIGSKAEISVIDNIYTIFDKSDSPSQKMGTYETQLRRMDSILMEASPYSLILLDEVDLGTDYSELQEVTRIMLDILSKKGPSTYITSHLHNIATEISENKFPKTINLSSEVITQNNKPYFTHKILRNKSEKSYGYIIREKVGFNKERYITNK